MAPAVPAAAVEVITAQLATIPGLHPVQARAAAEDVAAALRAEGWRVHLPVSPAAAPRAAAGGPAEERETGP